VTWRLTFDVRGYHTIERVLQLRSGRLLIVVDDSSGRRHILRSADASGTRFSAPVMNLPFVPGLDTPATAPRLLGSESWVQAPDGTIYIGEYVNDPHLIHLWRSGDDGKSFQVATTFQDVRHIHSLFIDPYAPDRVWVVIGDTREQSRIGYSDDKAETFTWISKDRYPESRAVGLMFTKQAVLWATDVPEVRSSLFRWDRTSGRVTSVLEGLNGPFYYTAQFGNAYAQFSAAFPKGQDGYLGDPYIHVISSSDGRTWSSTRTPWRIAESPPLKGLIYGITGPDNRGRFWVNFYGLAGASSKSGRTASFELQLVPR
jgi:hypothetical protein